MSEKDKWKTIPMDLTESRKKSGKKGGTKTAQNKEHMSAIGKKGGTKLSQNREYMAELGRRGGTTKRQKMADKIQELRRKYREQADVREQGSE